MGTLNFYRKRDLFRWSFESFEKLPSKLGKYAQNSAKRGAFGVSLNTKEPDAQNTVELSNSEKIKDVEKLPKCPCGFNHKNTGIKRYYYMIAKGSNKGLKCPEKL